MQHPRRFFFQLHLQYRIWVMSSGLFNDLIIIAITFFFLSKIFVCPFHLGNNVDALFLCAWVNDERIKHAITIKVIAILKINIFVGLPIMKSE